MKTTLAIALLALALSFCNLMGRRSNTNTNSNSPSSGEMAESTPASSPGEAPAREIESPPTLTQGVPPAPPRKSTPRAPISGGVLNGKAISKPQPVYPAIARAAKASGTVTVQITVDEGGNVISARPISGHPLLQPSAAAAARQAKFSPTLLSGQPVKVTGVITYNFVAQ